MLLSKLHQFLNLCLYYWPSSYMEQARFQQLKQLLYLGGPTPNPRTSIQYGINQVLQGKRIKDHYGVLM